MNDTELRDALRGDYMTSLFLRALVSWLRR